MSHYSQLYCFLLLKMSSCLNQEINVHRSFKPSLQAKTVLKKYVGGFWCERTTGDDFSLEEALIMDYDQKQPLKCLNDGFVYCTLLFSRDINWWTGLVWITSEVLWCLDSHSDGTHSLQRTHWWASDAVMLHFSKSFPMKKQWGKSWPNG